MRSFLLFIICLSSIVVYSQSYKNAVENQLLVDYEIRTVSYPFGNDESAINEASYIYGDAGQYGLAISNGQIFTEEQIIGVEKAGINPWDSGFGIRSTTAVSKGDAVLLTFFAKREVESESELSFFAEDGSTFDKEFLIKAQLTEDWQQYFISFEASKDYGVGELVFGIHLGAIQQVFYLAGWMSFNYEKNHELSELPNTFMQGAYDGSDPNSPWRDEANQYIEDERKVGISIIVKDPSGNPIADLPIHVEMLEHDFGFGSAFVTCRMPGNNCYDATYVEKLSNLDGKGHGFNVGVTENALKWDAWEEQWIGTPTEAVSAIQYLSEQGIEMRGHTLFWPGFGNMPDDINANRNDLGKIRDRINARIGTMINHPQLKGLIREWDVFNEIITNRDLEEIFQRDSNFETGREIYLEILKAIRDIDPELKLYLNDFIVLSGGGTTSATEQLYMDFIKELTESDIKIDGIGFQCHIGSSPTSIFKMRQTFTDYAELVGPNLSITEYDIEGNVDEEVQASYMSDILTAAFGHPAVNSFIMWGFWDNNHWKNNAAMFRSDWSIKPSGQVFIDKVFKEWWTDANVTSDDGGDAFLKGFKGRYRITVGSGDQAQSQEFYIDDWYEAEVTYDMTTSITVVNAVDFIIYPNPSNGGKLNIDLPQGISEVDVEIIDITGKVVFTKDDVHQSTVINHSLSNGSYYLKASDADRVWVEKLIVL